MAAKKTTSRRPPRSWWRSCVRKVRRAGGAFDAERVCGAEWYQKMSAAAKRRAKKRHKD